MKNLILIFYLLVVFTACSDEETNTDVQDPFLPVTGLQIPKKEFLGQEIVLHGKGFDKECSIQLQLGTNNIFKAEVISVTDDSIILRTPDLEAGFYIVLLTQGGQTYRIGGINLVATELENKYIDALGIVGEENSKVYEVSVTKKMKGEMLFALPGNHSFSGGVIVNGTWYYATYRHDEWETPSGGWAWANRFTVWAYDIATRENKALIEDLEGFLALGMIEDKLCIFTYDNEKCYIREWENGTFRNMAEFTNSSAHKMIAIYNGIFLYDASRRNIVMSGQDMTGDTRKLVWSVSLDNPQIKETGGETSVVFHLADCNGTFYAFGEKEAKDERVDTYVVRLNDPSDWAFAALTPEVVLKSTFISGPVFHKGRKIVYGVDDGETVVAYDVQAKQLTGGKWVGSELSHIFLLNN